MPPRSRLLLTALLVGATAGSLACAGAPADPMSVPGQPNAPAAAIRPLPQAQAMRSYSNMTGRQRLVVRDAATWATVWSEIAGNMHPVPAAPAVDFAKEVVIVASMGGQGSGGYSIEIDEVRIAAGNARISVTEHSPGKDCATTAALTAPVSVVLAPRFPGKATFVERTSVHACQ